MEQKGLNFSPAPTRIPIPEKIVYKNSNMVFMIRQYMKTTQKLASMKKPLYFNSEQKDTTLYQKV